MANVTYRETEHPPVGLESGDVIATDERHLMVGYSTETQDEKTPYILLDLSNGDAFLRFSHPVHIFNHIRKHYGNFCIFKAAQIDIIIKN